MLRSFLYWMLPRLATCDPALVNRLDAARRVVKRAEINFDLALIAAEQSRTADGTKASSSKRRYQTGIFKLFGPPIRIGEKS